MKQLYRRFARNFGPDSMGLVTGQKYPKKKRLNFFITVQAFLGFYLLCIFYFPQVVLGATYLAGSAAPLGGFHLALNWSIAPI